MIPLTVALLTYNRAGSFLPEAISGIQRQSYRDFEFLILDNGSTDHTAQLVLSLDDPRIRYVRNPVGTTVEYNHASAFHIAAGRRIVLTHDDDIMEPTMLAEEMRLMDGHPEVKLVGTSVRRIDPEGLEIDLNVKFSNETSIMPPGGYIRRFLFDRLVMMPSTVMIDRRALMENYRHAEDIYYADEAPRSGSSRSHSAGSGDVYLPASINTKRAIAFLDRPLLRYRVHPNQDTQERDLFQPSINLYAALRDCAHKVRNNSVDDDLFDCFVLKYELQQALCQNHADTLSIQTLRTLHRIYREAFGRTRPSAQALAVALPIYLAGALGIPNEHAPNRIIMSPQTQNLKSTGELPTAEEGFHRWAFLADRGCSLFSNVRPGSRLVLFGSVLVAALLIMDAQLHGVSIVACVDSQVGRQNTDLLGIPIYSPAWLRDNSNAFDLIVMTSEKGGVLIDQDDHEASLRRTVEAAAGRPVQTVSWKELAAGGLVREVSQ